MPGATKALMSLQQLDGALRLIVRDNGRGLENEDDGAGMAGMRERALHIGGRLDVRAAPGGGTEVVLDVPVPEGGA
jgi:two-component system, NarL family, sensor histidine kinase UhpB